MADTLASTVEVEQMIVLDKPSPDQSTTVQLVCSPQDGVLQCTDPQLRLEFAYPESWGLGTTTLTPSHYCGYSYVYRFDNSSIIAGGRSNPIAEPGRGGMITDFNGFGQRTRQQVCEDLSAAICEEIQPGVLLLIRVPSAESLCNGPGPGSFFAPEAIVVVDLPRSKTINGLVFVSGFVSEQLALTFPPLRPNNSRSGPATCSEASMARFNTTMQELTEQIKRDTVDEETRTNLVALRTLAQSFQGDSLRR